MGRTITVRKMLSNIRDEKYKRRDDRTSHGKSGGSLTMFKNRHFICWDGEGVEDATRPTKYTYNDRGDIVTKTEYQNYALLMNNEGIAIIDPSGLSTRSCLDTLMNSTEDALAIHVCFGASYDVNMMLRDVPEKDLCKLHNGESIDYGIYNIEYRAHKSFTIREYMNTHTKFRYDEKTKKLQKWYRKSLTLWDVFGFFGASFVETLKKYFVSGVRTPEEAARYSGIIAQIQEGKTRRGTFTEEELRTFVQPYCKLEVDALHDLMMRLHTHLTFADLKIARWDGVGACAAAMLKKYNVKEHLGRDNTPDEVTEVAEYAYFGGRVETLKYGNYVAPIIKGKKKKVKRKDINSAYPAETAKLPSLAVGKWHMFNSQITLQRASDVANKYYVSVFLVSWKMKKEKNILCPFPWRDKAGNVFFPPFGKGWIWSPELLVALEKMQDVCDFTIHALKYFVPGTDVKPFLFVPALFEYRKKLVEEGNGAEKVIKLALNSIYGKLAQSIGYTGKRAGGKPPYHNLIYAGLITSGTRAKLLSAALQKPKSVIMLATDGIYLTDDIEVEESATKEIGKWEAAEYDYMTIVASGVYWYSAEDEETSYSRGFDKYTILRDLVIQAWKDGKETLSCSTSRFVGLGSAIGLNSFVLWCTWRTIKRELGLNMDAVAKRELLKKTGNKPYNDLVQTIASVPKQLRSSVGIVHYPYQGDFMLSHKFRFMWDSERTDIIDGVNMRYYLDEVANTKA